MPIETLCLTFTLPGDDQYELLPKGSNIEVSSENLQQYIDSVSFGYLLDSVKSQAQNFKEGFNHFINIENLKCFESFEIEQVLCGTDEEKWDFEYLMQNVLATHGFTENSQTFKNFLITLSNFTAEEKKDFLMFTIGIFLFF